MTMAPDERARAVLLEFDGCAGCVPPEISVSAIAAAIREATAPLEARVRELEAALAAETEACAKVADAMYEAWVYRVGCSGYAAGARNVAKAIRERAKP